MAAPSPYNAFPPRTFCECEPTPRPLNARPCRCCAQPSPAWCLAACTLQGAVRGSVEVCPVDCFYEGENMLIIHPDECIDCGLCEPECPVNAIKPDTEAGLEKWLVLNREYAERWPNITAKKDAPKDADAYRDEKGKFDKNFSSKPGEGN